MNGLERLARPLVSIVVKIVVSPQNYRGHAKAMSNCAYVKHFLYIILLLLVAAHLLACMWIYTAHYVTHGPSYAPQINNWMIEGGIVDVEIYAMYVHACACCWAGRQATTSDVVLAVLVERWWPALHSLARSLLNNNRYTAAIYWAMTTLTTVGYGDISPTSTGERLLATGALIVGIAINALFIGRMSVLMLEFTEATTRKRRHAQLVEKVRVFVCACIHDA